MKKVALVMLSVFAFSTLSYAEDAPPIVNSLVTTLTEWGKNPVLVSAVKAENAKGKSLADIQAKDKQWMAVTGVDDFMSALMSNAAAKELKKLEQSKPYYMEVFLMDNQGANVAMTNKTSDYWQGDEAKFKESFNGGKGAVHVSKVKFDESSQAYLVQISVPVLDGVNVIGAITVGVNLDDLEAAR